MMDERAASSHAAPLDLLDAAPHNGGDEVAGVRLPLEHRLQVDAEELLYRRNEALDWVVSVAS